MTRQRTMARISNSARPPANNAETARRVGAQTYSGRPPTMLAAWYSARRRSAGSHSNGGNWSGRLPRWARKNQPLTSSPAGSLTSGSLPRASFAARRAAAPRRSPRHRRRPPGSLPGTRRPGTSRPPGNGWLAVAGRKPRGVTPASNRNCASAKPAGDRSGVGEPIASKGQQHRQRRRQAGRPGDAAHQRQRAEAEPDGQQARGEQPVSGQDHARWQPARNTAADARRWRAGRARSWPPAPARSAARRKRRFRRPGRRRRGTRFRATPAAVCRRSAASWMLVILRAAQPGRFGQHHRGQQQHTLIATGMTAIRQPTLNTSMPRMGGWHRMVTDCPMLNSLGTDLRGPSTPMFSVVVPTFNEADGIAAFHIRLAAVMDRQGTWEAIYVDDGAARISRSPCSSGCARIDPRIAVVALSRNFGKEIAMTAGLDHATRRGSDRHRRRSAGPAGSDPAADRAHGGTGYDMVYASDPARRRKLVKSGTAADVLPGDAARSGSSSRRTPATSACMSRRAVDACCNCANSTAS